MMTINQTTSYFDVKKENDNTRLCLGCQRMFLSVHVGNRICPACVINGKGSNVDDTYSIAKKA